jgi:uncharacterized protein (DUF849 family)
MLLEACLNGARTRAEHPGVPHTAEEIARDARASVEAGAHLIHLHAYDGDEETFAAEPTAEALRAVRALCPGVPISLSTSAEIEADPRRRLELIAGWSELPELVSANLGEPGIVELCEHLLARGVGIEAGLLELADAHSFVSSGIVERCARVLVETLRADPQEAVAEAAAIEQVLADAGVGLEQVHHGDQVATWAVMDRGLARGHGTRAGLEDMTVLPDGVQAAGNAELVRVAAAMISAV